MSDYSLPLLHEVICGKSGSGKTTLAFQRLNRQPGVRCRFIFDDRGQAAHRLNRPAAATALELEKSLASGWVIFNPWRMFDDSKAAFRFFCEWVYEVSKRGRGRKMFFVDEVWQHVNPNGIPPEFANIVQAGRVEHIQLITATQRPHKLNEAITGNAAVIHCFRLEHRLALKCIDDLQCDPVAVEALKLGSYITYDLENGKETRGKVF